MRRAAEGEGILSVPIEAPEGIAARHAGSGTMAELAASTLNGPMLVKRNNRSA
jgi:hypothetical protein